MKQALNIDFSYFADLGSGNGLLTHLLTLDGFKGNDFTGLDVFILMFKVVELMLELVAFGSVLLMLAQI